MTRVLTIALTAAAAIAGVSVIGFSQAPKAIAASNTQCVDAGSLQTRRVIDRNKMFVEDSWGRAAILTLSQPCSQMDEMDRIGFEFSGTTQICSPHDVQVLYSRQDERPVQCIITDVRPLTKDEAKAYSSGSDRR